MFGLYVKFVAQAGQRDALVAHLLHAADLLRDLDSCYLYAINVVPADDVTVWVTEIWRDEVEQQASLRLDAVQAVIDDVLPLLASRPERITLEPVGGKGMPRSPGEEASP